MLNEGKHFNICIVGGGSRYTPGILRMMVHEMGRFPLDKVILYDCEYERQHKVWGYAKILFAEEAPGTEVIETCDPETAFTGIDFAMMQIRAGRMKMREMDEHIALKHGCIGQETCGAGGFAYGMRSIPAVCKLIEQIRQYSPEAWILNYSNPAAIVAEATRRLYPDDYRVINICDMPVGIMSMYADMLGKKSSELEPRYYGLNHFGWFTHVYDKETGEDYLPKIRALYEKAADDPDDHGLDHSWAETFRFMVKMIREEPEGILPNTYLQYYLYPRHMLGTENPEYTRANEVMDGSEKKTFEMLDEVVAAGKLRGTKYAYDPDDTSDGHATYIVDLAYALAHNTGDVFLCMTENHGIISNCTDTMMVEVPCHMGIHGPEPLNVGPIPDFQKGLMENQNAYERLTVEANLEGNYRKAWQALTLNRLVNDKETAKALLDDYIVANKGYWPELK